MFITCLGPYLFYDVVNSRAIYINKFINLVPIPLKQDSNSLVFPAILECITLTGRTKFVQNGALNNRIINSAYVSRK
jgi:hypothetical protein